jgi:hypothetical protein
VAEEARRKLEAALRDLGGPMADELTASAPGSVQESTAVTSVLIALLAARDLVDQLHAEQRQANEDESG